MKASIILGPGRLGKGEISFIKAAAVAVFLGHILEAAVGGVNPAVIPATEKFFVATFGFADRHAAMAAVVH